MYAKAKLSKKAFTLVELLVVIAIIALLLSVLMPALSKVRNQARKVVCSSNLKQLSFAYFGFVGENGRLGSIISESRPYPFWFLSSDDGGADVLWWHHKLGLAGYIKGFSGKTMAEFISQKLPPQEVTRCPAESKYAGMDGKDAWNTWKGSAYGFNHHLTTSYPGYGGNRPGTPPSGAVSYINPKKLDQVKGPGNVCLMADGNPRPYPELVKGSALTKIPGYSVEVSFKSAPTDRHKDSVGVVYLDGHSAPVRLKKSTSGKWMDGVDGWPRILTTESVRTTDTIYFDIVKFWSQPDYAN